MSDTTVRAVFVNPSVQPGQAHAAAKQFLARCEEMFSRGVERIAATAQEEEDAKTVQQGRFYWGVVLREISEQAAIGETKYSAEAWHELFKRQFLPRRKKLVRVAGKSRPIVSTTIGSTQGLSVRAMSAYIEQCLAFAQTDLNVQFSETRWENHR